MPKKGTITREFEKAVKKKERELEGDRSYLALKEANDFYNKLLEDGIAKKRGFTLRGIEDSHLFQIRLNSRI